MKTNKLLTMIGTTVVLTGIITLVFTRKKTKKIKGAVTAKLHRLKQQYMNKRPSAELEEVAKANV